MRRRKSLILQLAISLFGVMVTAVSTFAWFTVSINNNTAINPGTVQSGSSSVDITGVTGYKYVYDELGNNNVDYSNGHIAAFGDTAYDSNIHQGEVTSLDAPTEGIGYYIVGNEKFCELNGFETQNAWKYSASIRLDDDSSITTNRARLINVNLYSTSYTAEEITAAGGINNLDHVEFKVRHHYIDSTGTHDVWMDTKIATNDDSVATLSLADGTTTGNFKMTNNTSANFTIYLNNSWEIALIRNGNAPAVNSRIHAKGRVHLDTAINGNSSLIYFDLNSFKNYGNPHWYVYWSDTNSFNELSMSNYKGSVSIGTHTGNVVFLVCWNTSDKWNGCWQTPDTSINSLKGKWMVSTSEGKPCAYKICEHTDPGYYILGENGSCQGTPLSWSPSGAVKVDDTPTMGLDGNYNKAEKYDVHFIPTDDNLQFKIVQYNEYGEVINNTYYNYGGTDGTDASTYVGQGTNDSGYRVRVKKECTADIYLNSSGQIYVMLAVTVTLKYKTTYNTYNGSTTTSNLSSSWTNYGSVLKINYNSSYAAPDSTYISANLPSGCSSWCGTWYTNEACTTPYSTANQTTALTLYTKFAQTAYTITLQVGYTNEGGTVITTSGSSDATHSASKDSTVTVSALNTWSATLRSEATSGYTFAGYYWTNNSTSTQINSTIPANTFTSAKTIYLIYSPTAHTVTYNYVYFDGSTNVTASVTNNSNNPSSGTCYETSHYTPTNPAYDVKYLKTGSGLGFSLYIFRFQGWYTNATCTTPYANNAAAFTANTNLYAMMESISMSSLYLNTENVDWSSPYISFFIPSDGQSGGADDYSDNLGLTSLQYCKEFSSNNYIYKISFPTEYSFNICANSSYGQAYEQTGNISMTATDADGHSKATENDWVYLRHPNNSGNKEFTWQTFYGRPTNGTSSESNGYYLVGVLKNASTTWTFENAWKMTALTSSDRTNYGLSDTYDYAIGLENGFNITEIQEFQIWEYDYQSGRGRMYDYGEVATSDTETNGIVTYNGNNIKINDNVTGTKFAIFLNKDGTENGHNSIYVQDREKSATLYFSNQLEQYSTSEFKLGHGDFDNNDTDNIGRTAVYEKGIYITADDIANNGGGIDFIVRCKNRGSYKWYCYNGKNGRGAARSGVSGDPTFIVSGSNAGTLYGDEKSRSASGYTMYRINRKGYYCFYVLEEGTIAVTEIPAEYGEGFYIMPQLSNTTAGVTDTQGWRDGAKMKVLYNASNVALFTCYKVQDDGTSSEEVKAQQRSVFIRGFLGGVDVGLVSIAGPGVYNASTDDSSKEATALATLNNDTKIITFNTNGSYNIYIYRVGSSYGISVTEYTENQFFSMNTIRRTSAQLATADYVKRSNTSFIFKVDFTLKNTAGITSKACVDKIISGTGIGSSLLYTCIVDPDLLGLNCYNYMRDNCYGSLSNSNSQVVNTSLTGSVEGTHHTLYIMVDYNPTMVPTLPFTGNTLNNNFFFVLKMTQEV